MRKQSQLTLFGPGFFSTLKDQAKMAKMAKMAHRHNSCVSSQMKLKFSSNIKRVMLTSNSQKDRSSLF